MSELRLHEIDNELAKRYLKIESPNCPPDYRAILWLESDIAYILSMQDDIYETANEIRMFIKESYGKESLDRIDFDNVIIKAIIKHDWEKALEHCVDVSDIASIVGFGFSDYDISNLAKLHKRSAAKEYMRERIEHLLDYCNFHYESGEFANGNYDKYIKKV